MLPRSCGGIAATQVVHTLVGAAHLQGPHGVSVSRAAACILHGRPPIGDGAEMAAMAIAIRVTPHATSVHRECDA